VREYPGTGATYDTLTWGSSCVSGIGSKRKVSVCNNDVSRRRDGETDRNDIEFDRGQTCAMGTGTNMLKSWQHK